MLGHVGLLDPELFNQLPGGQLAIAQQFDNRDPRRICQSLKDLALELPECIGHLCSVYSNNRILSSCDERLCVANAELCRGWTLRRSAAVASATHNWTRCS